MSISVSQTTIIKLLSGFLEKLTDKEKELFYSKLIEERGASLEKLIEYVKSPNTFRYLDLPNGKELSLGDTIYVDANHLWGTAIQKGIKNNTIIDGLLRPATVVDFEFFPEMRVIVHFHADGKTKERIAIHDHYLCTMDLV